MHSKDSSTNHSITLKIQSGFEKELNQFLPEAILPFLSSILAQERVQLYIAGDRLSKLGDYHLHPQKGHVISINSNLNPYAFSITLIHELAHLKAFKVYSRKIKPHGEEWKHTFKALMHWPLRSDAYPDDVKIALMKHMKNPKASSVRDIDLRKVLAKYDTHREDEMMLVDDIPMGGVFELNNGQQFRKLEKLRTRFKCEDIASGRMYFVNRTAEAKLIE